MKLVGIILVILGNSNLLIGGESEVIERKFKRNTISYPSSPRKKNSLHDKRSASLQGESSDDDRSSSGDDAAPKRAPVKPVRFLRPSAKPLIRPQDKAKLPTPEDIDTWSDVKVKSYFTEERAPHRLKELKNKQDVNEMRAYLKDMFKETPKVQIDIATASDAQIYRMFGSHVKPDLVRALHGYKFKPADETPDKE